LKDKIPASLEQLYHQNEIRDRIMLRLLEIRNAGKYEHSEAIINA